MTRAPRNHKALSLEDRVGLFGVVVAGLAVASMVDNAVWAIALRAPGLSSPMEPASGLHPSGFDPTIAGEQR